MVQVARYGLIPANQRRLMCLSMFWHFLDVIWIGVLYFCLSDGNAAMKTDAHAAHDDHGDGAAHGSLRSYLTGFGLSVVLTVIPFWLVMTGVFESKQATALVIMALAAVQIVVHMIYFLHMSPKSENG